MVAKLPSTPPTVSNACDGPSSSSADSQSQQAASGGVEAAVTRNIMHECETHTEWLVNTHYMCSCGHVEWAHYGTRLSKGHCAHCNCTQYRGETRPLTEHELKTQDGTL